MDDLISFLRIPSISADPAYAGETRLASEFVVQWLKRAGFRDARLIEASEAGGHPLIRADYFVNPQKPTLLLYGHYDVQPPDPLEEWISPPFEPVIRDGNLYARGAADDKGQLFILMTAVARCIANGSLGYNVKFLIEGEEESSGRHIEKFVEEHGEELSADAAVICDTAMFAPGLPTITTGLRGIVYGEIIVEGAAHDLHSGDYGGAAPNALEAAARIIAVLKSADGKILIPGFYDRVNPPSDAEIEAWKRLPFDAEDFREREIGSPALVGEPGVDVLTRLWARPTFEVHGIRGGYTGEGSKTVIPARVSAKISMRLVPEQEPWEIAAMLARAIDGVRPQGVHVRFELMHASPPSLVNPENPHMKKVAAALEKVFGKPPAYVRCGGSIPIVDLFERRLGVPSILPGFGLPDDNIHAPNEKINIFNYLNGIEAMEEYFGESEA